MLNLKDVKPLDMEFTKAQLKRLDKAQRLVGSKLTAKGTFVKGTILEIKPRLVPGFRGNNLKIDYLVQFESIKEPIISQGPFWET